MASSHALIFANGDINDGEMVARALATARGQSTLVVAADGGARVAAHFGLNIDAVIGDMDSLDEEEVSSVAARGAQIHRFPQEKNETDLELALAWAVRRGARWLRIVGAVGDRLDQTLANIYLLALPVLRGCDARMVAGKQEAWLAMPGEHLIEGAQGDTVSLIPLSGPARGVRTEQLYYPLNDEDLFFGPARGVSNLMAGAQARVTLRDGVLLVVHTVGRA
jgi:thiamine pyrophosphokinase